MERGREEEGTRDLTGKTGMTDRKQLAAVKTVLGCDCQKL